MGTAPRLRRPAAPPLLWPLLALALAGTALAGTVGADGAIFSAGFIQGDETHANRQQIEGATDAFLSRLVPETGANWTLTLDSGDEDYAAPSVALDGEGNAYFAGATRGALSNASSNAGGFDVFVSRAGPENGTLAWTTAVGSRFRDEANRVFYDARDDAVYVLGHTWSALDDGAHAGNSLRQGGGRDVVLLKLAAADGARLWTRQFGTDRDDSGYAVVGLDSNHSSVILSGRASLGHNQNASSSRVEVEVDPLVRSWRPQRAVDERALLWFAEFSMDNGTLTDEWMDGGVTLSSHALLAAEAGSSSAEYTVVLNSAPAAAVTIAVEPAALRHDEQVYSTTDAVTQLAVAPAALTFTEANWDRPQTVAVTAVDDAVVEGVHYSTVVHSARSADPLFDDGRVAFLRGRNVSVTITDDDSASVEISKSFAYVVENGATDQYAVWLTSQPAADVTVHCLGTAQVTVDPQTLVFSAASWNVTQTVVIAAVDDSASENPYGGTHAGGFVRHYVSSDDYTYDTRQPRCYYVPVCSCPEGAEGAEAETQAGYCRGAEGCHNATALTCDTDPWDEVAAGPGGVPQACTNHVFGNGYCANRVLPDGKYSEPVLTVPPRFGAADPNPNPPNSTLLTAGIGEEATELKTQEAFFPPLPQDFGRGYVHQPHPAPHRLVFPNPNAHPRAQSTVPELDLEHVPADVLSLLLGWLGVADFDALQSLAQDASALKEAACTGVKRLTLHRWAWEEWPVGTAERMLEASYLAFEHLDDGDLLGCGVAAFNQSSSIRVAVADNDPAVTLSKRFLTTAEGGATDAYTVVLNAPPAVDSWASDSPWCDAPLSTGIELGKQPGECLYADADPAQRQWQCYNASAAEPCASDALFPRTASFYGSSAAGAGTAGAVTVAITGDGHVTAEPAELTFTEADWYLPQTVVVVAVDDWVDERTENHTLEHWVACADDARYDGDEVRVWAGPEANANPMPFWDGAADSSYNPHPDWDRAPRHFRLLATVVDDDEAGVRVSRAALAVAEQRHDTVRAHSGWVVETSLAAASALTVEFGTHEMLLTVDLPSSPGPERLEAVEVMLFKQLDGQVHHQGQVSQEEGAEFVRGVTEVFDPVLVHHHDEVGGPDDGGGTLYRATLVELNETTSTLVRLPTAIGQYHALDVSALARTALDAGLQQMTVRLEGLRELRNDTLYAQRYEAQERVPAAPVNLDSDGLRASSTFSNDSALNQSPSVRFVYAAEDLALAANATSGNSTAEDAWYVDLGSVQPVGSIVVWAEQELPSGAQWWSNTRDTRTVPAEIFPFSIVAWDEAGHGEYHEERFDHPQRVTVWTPNVNARYVRVTTSRLAQVQVFAMGSEPVAGPTPGTLVGTRGYTPYGPRQSFGRAPLPWRPAFVNLAAGRNATASSADPSSGGARVATDGDTLGLWDASVPADRGYNVSSLVRSNLAFRYNDTYVHRAATARTLLEQDPWWQVDLGEDEPSVGTVLLWLLTNGDQTPVATRWSAQACCAALDAPLVVSALAADGATELASVRFEADADPPAVLEAALNARGARFVRVQLEGVARLALAEVQVGRWNPQQGARYVRLDVRSRTTVPPFALYGADSALVYESPTALPAPGGNVTIDLGAPVPLTRLTADADGQGGRIGLATALALDDEFEVVLGLADAFMGTWSLVAADYEHVQQRDNPVEALVPGEDDDFSLEYRLPVNASSLSRVAGDLELRFSSAAADSATWAVVDATDNATLLELETGAGVDGDAHVVVTYDRVPSLLTLYVNQLEVAVTYKANGQRVETPDHHHYENSTTVARALTGASGDGDEGVLYAEALPQSRVLDHYRYATGGAGSYDVRLTSQPLRDVTVATLLDAGQCKRPGLCNVTVSPAALTFTPGNWNVSQSVVVAAVDDDLFEADQQLVQITHAVRSSEAYKLVSGLNMTGMLELHNATAEAMLTLAANLDDLGRLSDKLRDDDVAATNASLRAQSELWRRQLVEEAFHRLDGYSGAAAAAVLVAVTDNDAPAVNVSTTRVFVKEDNYTDTYTLALATEPAADVVVFVHTDNDCVRDCGYPTDPDCGTNVGADPARGFYGNDYWFSNETDALLCNVTASPVNLTFSPDNWALPQTVVVTAVDDNLDEGAPHNSTVSHSAASADPGYDGLWIANVTASVTDNDFSAVALVDATVSLLEENGTSDRYQVVLHSEPWSAVTVAVHTDLYGECHRPCAGAEADGDDCGEGTLVHEEISFATSSAELREQQTLTSYADVLSERQLIRTTVTYVEPVHRVVLSPDAAGSFALRFGAAVTGALAVDASDADVQDAVSALSTVGGVLVERSADGLNITITLTGMPQGNLETEFEIAEAAGAGLTAGSAHVVVVRQYWFLGGSFRIGLQGEMAADALPYNASADAVREALEGLSGVGDIRVLAFPLTASGDVEWQIEFLTNIGDIELIEVDGGALTGEGHGIEVETIQDGNTPGGSFTLLFGGSSFVHSEGVSAAAPAAHDVLDALGRMPFARENQTGVTTLVSTAVLETPPLPFNASADAVRGAIADLNLTAAPYVSREGVDCGFAGRCHSYVWTVDFSDTPGNVPELEVDFADMTGLGVGVAVDTVVEGNWISGEFSLTLTTADGGLSATTDPLPANASAFAVDRALEALAPLVSERQGDPHNEPKYGVTTTRLGPDMQGGYNWTAVFSVLDTAASPGGLQLDVNVTALQTAASTLVVSSRYDVLGNDRCEAFDNRSVYVGGECLFQPAATVLAARWLCNTTLSPTSLTFSPTNWNLPQDVRVTAVDDSLDEHTYNQFGVAAVHESLLAHTVSSDDYRFDQILVANASVRITDNDVAEVLLSAHNVTASEDGATGGYNITLSTEPRHDVLVSAYNFYNGDGTMCYYMDMCNLTLSPSTLTFTPSNWYRPQTVTARAVDDPLDEWDEHTALVDHAVTSADLKYHRIDVPAVLAVVTDNDDSEVVVSNASVAATEGRPDLPGLYTLRLATEPFSKVTVSVAGDASRGKGLTVDPESIVFSWRNWYEPQTVAVVPVDDEIAEGAHESTVFHAANSADKIYDGIDVDVVAAVIADNDNASVVISNTTMYVAEGGAQGNYSVVLSSEPWQTVTVSVIAPEDQDGGLPCYRAGLCNVTAAPASLVFTIDDWHTPQEVRVAAVDDHLDEHDPHPAELWHAASSGDGSYGEGISVDTVHVVIADNDVAAVSVLTASRPPHGMVVSEGGFTDTYTIVLDTEPFLNVKVTLETPLVTIIDALVPQRNLTTRQVEFDGDTLLYNKWAIPPIAGDTFELTGVLEEPENMRNYTIFTPDNWDQPQTVLVTAVEDELVEGTNQTTTIDHVVESDDPYYNGTARSPQIAVDITESDTVPPPIATELVFSESGGELELAFDSDAYHAATTEVAIDPDTLADVYTRVAGSFDCALVFVSVAALGDDADCEWLSLSALVVRLGSGATIEPGDDLAFHDCGAYDVYGACSDELVVKALRSSQLISSGIPAVTVPDDIVQPESVLDAPEMVGTCSELVIDASASTGGAGRSFAYSWSFYPGELRARAENETAAAFEARVEQEEADLAAVDCAFAANDSYVATVCAVREALEAATYELVVPVGAFASEPGYYTFTLEVENFLGGTGSRTTTVQALSSPLPQLLRDGAATRSVFRADGVFVETTASIACPEEAGTAMEFEWEQLAAEGHEGEDLPSLNTAASARNLRIEPGVLTAGASYTLRVTVRMADNAAAASTATVTIEVGYADVVASIAGGASRVVGVADGLVLDAESESYDPDEASGVVTTYAWSCSPSSSCPFEGELDGGLLDLSNATLVDGAELVFTVTVTVACAECEWPPYERDSEDRCPSEPVLPGLPENDPLEPCSVAAREAAASATVVVVDSSVPTVSLLRDKVAARVNADAQLPLKGAVVWDGAATDPVVSTLWVQEAGSLDMGNSRLFSRALTTLSLYVRAGALVPGSSYTFALTATTASGRVGSARFTVEVNTPPSLGSVAVTPASGGVSGSTLFDIQCLDWTDSAADLPLRYSYAADGAPLARRRYSAQLAAYLPVGAPLVAVRVAVLDQLGASTAATVYVESLAASAVLSFARNQTDTALQGALDAEDSLTTMQLIQSLGSVLRAAEPAYSTPAGAACPVQTSTGLQCGGRGSCSTTSRTCRCSTGYSGKACGIAAAESALRREVRTALVAALVQCVDWLELGDEEMGLQVAQGVVELAAAPDELDATSQGQLLSALATVVDGGDGAMEAETGDAMLDALGLLVQASSSSSSTSSSSSRRRRLDDWAAQMEQALDLARQTGLLLVQDSEPTQPAVDATADDVRLRVRREYLGELQGASLGLPLYHWVPIALPASLSLAADNSSSAVVDAVAITWARDPHRWHNSSSQSVLFSDVVSLSLHSTESAEALAESGAGAGSGAVSVELGHSWTNAHSNLTAECRRWDGDAEGWATAGCRVAAEGANTTTCRCEELGGATDFALFLVDYTAVLLPPVDRQPVDTTKMSLPRATLAVVFVLYTVGVTYGVRKDNRERFAETDKRLARAVRHGGIQRLAVSTMLSVIHRTRKLTAEEAAVVIQSAVRRRLLGTGRDPAEAMPNKGAILRYAAQVRATIKRKQLNVGSVVTNIWTTQEAAVRNAAKAEQIEAERRAELDYKRAVTVAAATDRVAAEQGGHLRGQEPVRGYRARHVVDTFDGAGGETVVRRHRRRRSVLSFKRAKDKAKYYVRVALGVVCGVQLLAAAIAIAVGFDLALALGYVENYAIQSIFTQAPGAALCSVGFLLVLQTPAVVWGVWYEHRQALRAIVGTLILTLMVMCTVILVIANNAYYYREYPGANTDVIDSWAQQSSQVQDDIQTEFGCCGWATLTDNPLEPCPEEALELDRSCQELVISEVVDTLMAVVWCLVASLVIVVATAALAFVLVVRKEIEELEVRFKVLLSRSMLTMRRVYGVCCKCLFLVAGLLLLMSFDFIAEGGYVALGAVMALFSAELGFPLLLMSVFLFALAGVGAWASTQFRSTIMVFFAVAGVALLVGDILLAATLRKLANDLDEYPGVDEWFEDRWVQLSQERVYEAQHAFSCCGYREGAEPDEDLCPVAGYYEPCREHVMSSASDLLMGFFYMCLSLVVGIGLPVALVFALLLHQRMWPPDESAVQREERLAHLRITDPYYADKEGAMTQWIMAALAVLNVCFIILAVIIGCAGLDVLFSTGYVGHEVVTEVFFADRAGWLLATAALVFGCAVVGLQGGLQRHKGLLFVYMAGVVLALLLGLYGGAAAWRAYTSEAAFRRVDDAVERAWYDLPASSRETAQSALECCGYLSASDSGGGGSGGSGCEDSELPGCRDALMDLAVGLSGTMLGVSVAVLLLLILAMVLSCLVFHRQGPVRRQISRLLLRLKTGQLAACGLGLCVGAVMLLAAVDLLSGAGFFVGGPVAVMYGAAMGGCALLLWMALSSASLVGLWGALYHHLGCQMAYASIAAAVAVVSSTVAALAAGASSTDVADALSEAWTGASLAERAEAEDLLLCCGFAALSNGSHVDRAGGGDVCPANATTTWTWGGAAGDWVPGCRDPFVAEAHAFLDPFGYSLVFLVFAAMGAAALALLVVREIRRAEPWEWSKYVHHLDAEVRRYGAELRRQHTLVSQPFGFDRVYSRPQRLSALLVAAMCSMTVVSVVFDSWHCDLSGPEAACATPTAGEQVALGGVAAVLAFPVYMAAVLLFHAVAWRQPRETAKQRLERGRRQRVMGHRAAPSTGWRGWLHMAPEERSELFVHGCRRTALWFNALRVLLGALSAAFALGIAVGWTDYQFYGETWEAALMFLMLGVGAVTMATALLAVYGVGTLDEFPTAARSAFHAYAVAMVASVGCMCVFAVMCLVATTGAGTAESLAADTGFGVERVTADAWVDMTASARVAWQEGEGCCGFASLDDAPELPCPNVTATLVETAGDTVTESEGSGSGLVEDVPGCYPTLRRWISDGIYNAGAALVAMAVLEAVFGLYPVLVLLSEGSFDDPLDPLAPLADLRKALKSTRRVGPAPAEAGGADEGAGAPKLARRGEQQDGLPEGAEGPERQRRPSMLQVVKDLFVRDADNEFSHRNRGRRRSSLSAEYIGRRDSFVETGFYADRLRNVLQTQRFQDVTFKRAQRLKTELEGPVRSASSLLPWWALNAAHVLVAAVSGAMVLTSLPYMLDLDGRAADAWFGCFAAAVCAHLLLLEPLGVLAREVAIPAAVAMLRDSFMWRVGQFAAQSILQRRLREAAADALPKWAEYDLFPLYTVREHAAKLIQRRWRAKIFRRQFAVLLVQARQEALERRRLHRLECVRTAWSQFSEEEIDAFRLLFLDFDRDRSGTVSVNEIATACRRMGRPVPRTKIASLMQEVDVENSGELDFGEFLFVISAIGAGASNALLRDAAARAMHDLHTNKSSRVDLSDIVQARTHQAQQQAQISGPVQSTADVRRAGGKVRPKGVQLLQHTRLPPVAQKRLAAGAGAVHPAAAPPGATRAVRQIVQARDKGKAQERHRKLLRGRNKPIRVATAAARAEAAAVEVAVRALESAALSPPPGLAEGPPLDLSPSSAQPEEKEGASVDLSAASGLEEKEEEEEEEEKEEIKGLSL